MKSKHFLLLILLSSISFMGLSTGNKSINVTTPYCKNSPAKKCNKQLDQPGSDKGGFKFSSLNQSLLLI